MMKTYRFKNSDHTIAVINDTTIAVGKFTSEFSHLNYEAEQLDVTEINTAAYMSGRREGERPEKDYIAYKFGQGKIGGRFAKFFVSPFIKGEHIAPDESVAICWALNSVLGTHYKVDKSIYLNHLVNVEIA